MMLNIAGLNGQELTRLVTERCGEFGSVDSVRILDLERATTDRFALVHMSTPDATSKLSRALQTSKIGDCVLLRLEQSY